MDEDRINHLIQSGKEKEVVKLAMLYAIGHSDRAKMKDLPLSSESMEKICRHVDIHKLAASVELLNFQKAHTAMNWGKYIPPKAA